MIYQGKVENGVVILPNGVQLPDGTAVRVEPMSTDDKDNAIETGDGAVFRMSELAVDTGIRDLATNVDHYLYGHSKVDDIRTTLGASSIVSALR